MTGIEAIIKRMMEKNLLLEMSTPLTIEELEKKKVDSYNAKEGSKHLEDGVKCAECKNKGETAHIHEDYIIYQRCKCMDLRDSIYRLKRSGISQKMLNKYTFKNFKTENKVQESLKSRCLAFVADNLDSPGTWLYVGGQSGAGKTHLCTSICQRLARKYTVRYELWSRVAGLIKSVAFEQADKDKLMRELSKPDVLYIDDLLKGHSKITDGDIKALFELINMRYLNNKAITILSSELTIEDLRRIDEAIAGRIAERTGEGLDYALTIPKNFKMNYRFKEVRK